MYQMAEKREFKMKLTKIMLGGALLLSSATFAVAQDQQSLQVILCGDDTWGGAVNAAHAAEWEAENPGYTVAFEYVPWGQCQEKATTLASAGSPPAVAYMGSRTLKQLAQNDLIMSHDLSDEEKASWAGPILGTVTAGGEVWGLPRAFSTKALYWNKDLFAAAGLDPESPPKTWDEMYEAAKAIKEKTDADGFGLAAASFDNTMHQFMNYVYTNGGEVINAEGEIVFNSPNNVQALEFYGKMAEVSQPGPVAYDRAKLRPLFVENKIGMFISGPWERQQIGDINWGVAPIPVGPMGTPGTLLITDSYAVFKGSNVEDAALSFAKYMTSPDKQMEFEIAAGLTPLRPDHPEVAKMREADPTWGAFLDAIETGGPEPFVTDYVGLQDVINEAVQGVVLGEVSAEEAVATAAEDLEEYK